MRRMGAAVWLPALLLTGTLSCAPHREPTTVRPTPAPRVSVDRYRAFVKDNIALLNDRYASTYCPCEFVVDTETGSAPVQALMTPSAVQPVVDTLVDACMSRQEIIDSVAAYVRGGFDFIDEPQPWVHVRDTLRRRSGDCKNLSLLIVAMLDAAGVGSYGAVSNGHMWVRVRSDDRWQVIETDPDPQHRRLYGLPGFYDLPLYRLYPDRCEKRCRRSPGG